jgi:hypothetical protein
LDNIIKKFLTERNIQDRNNNEEEAEEEGDVTIDKSKLSDKGDYNLRTKQQNENVKNCIDTLLKIIYIGLDKNYEDFCQDINLLSQPLVKITEKFNMMTNTTIKNTPITSLRKLLKPRYNETYRLYLPHYDNNDIIIDSSKGFNLYETFKISFKILFESYFSHLKENEYLKEENINEMRRKRRNLFLDYRMKLVLIEDKKILTSFINQLFNIHKRFDENTEIELNEDFCNFWDQFTNVKDFDVNYVLYLLPRFENYKDILPQISKENKTGNTPLLSEFIAANDYVYQSLVFNPWILQKEIEITSYHEKMEEFKKYKSDFNHP